MNVLPLNRNLYYSSVFAACALLPWTATPAPAQTSPALQQLATATSPFAPSLSPAESSSLPDAPEPAAAPVETRSSAHIAPLYEKEIPAGWQAQTLTSRDKVVLGVRDLYTIGNFEAMFAASGFSHLTNGQPNYGTDRGAYGERLGAAALRETSQGFLTDSVFAPLLHQDPRYFVLGPQYGTVHRGFYALTRPFVRRTDDGRNTFNSSLMLGYGAAAVLTNAYYPAGNRNATDTARTFGASIGGAALGFLVSEYADQVLVAVHLRRPE